MLAIGKSVANAYPLRQLISSALLSPLRKPCLAGQSWRWHALRIEVLAATAWRGER